MLTMDDRDIIRGLAMQAAAIAALPVQEEKRKLWRKLNALNPECREYEHRLRRTLFQWKHFPVDMVVEPYIRVYKAIHNAWLGVGLQEQVAVSDAANSVVGHKYENQF